GEGRHQRQARPHRGEAVGVGHGACNNSASSPGPIIPVLVACAASAVATAARLPSAAAYGSLPSRGRPHILYFPSRPLPCTAVQLRHSADPEIAICHSGLHVAGNSRVCGRTPGSCRNPIHRKWVIDLMASTPPVVLRSLALDQMATIQIWQSNDYTNCRSNVSSSRSHGYGGHTRYRVQEALMNVRKLTVAATVVAAISIANVAPASAQHWHGGWGHGGFGHWHGGWGGAGLGFGLAAGALALGALAASPYYYGYPAYPAYYGGPYGYYGGGPYGYYGGGPYGYYARPYYGYRVHRWHRWHHW